MASRPFYRAAFEALKTEEERVLFCLRYLRLEVLFREGLPEGFTETVLENMKGALEDVGRPDLWDRIERAWERWWANPERGKPDAEEQFSRDLLGE